MDKIDPDEITVKELVRKIKSSIKYLRRRRRTLLLFCVVGILLGIVYSFVQTPVYKATSTFVLEEAAHGAGGALGQYSSLASLAGIDLGGGSEKGLFQGDNILELYKSRLMIEKTLLTQVESDGKKQLLINRYLESGRGWFGSVKKSPYANMDFSVGPKKFSRKQDSIMRDIIKYFNKKILTVTKPDKKLSIISVDVKYSDEVFAQLFNQTLVQNVNNFYIQTQTRKSTQSVSVLQRQADSVRNILNASLGKVAATTDATPNPNPVIKSLLVPYQKRQIDVQANSAIYAEVVKNLEVAKISLRQETPLIQLIDEPILPLDIDKTGKIMGALLGLVSGFFLGIFFIVAARVYSYVKNT